MGVRSVLLALVLLAAPVAALPLPALPCGVPGAPCGPANPEMDAPGSDGMPLGWSRYVNAACDSSGVAQTSAAARSGPAGVRVVDGATACAGFVSDPFPVVGGLVYNASLHVRAVEGAPLARIFVAWYQNDGSVVELYLYKDGFQTAPGAEWRSLASRTAAPAGALTARIWAYAPLTSSGTFDVDDASFVEDDPTL